MLRVLSLGGGHMKRRSELYVHRSLVPLREAGFTDPTVDQIDMFNNDCEGVCGV